MRFWPESNPSRPQPCFSSRSRKAAKQDKWLHCSPQDQLHWLMTPLPLCWPITGDQDPDKTHLESRWILRYSLGTSPKISTLKTPTDEDPAHSPSLGAPLHLSPPPPLPLGEIPLSSSFWISKDSSFCYCKLLSEPISSTAHFYLYDFLNKLAFVVWVLAVNSFLARTQVPKLLNQSPAQTQQANTQHWCHSRHCQHFVSSSFFPFLVILSVINIRLLWVLNLFEQEHTDKAFYQNASWEDNVLDFITEKCKIN